mgnify:CR=1 FL=1
MIDFQRKSDRFFLSHLIVLPELANSGYVYNNKQQVVLKIDNLDSIISINDDLTLFSDCYYQNLYPDSMVTTYNYDDNTNSLISVIDPKCDKITYTYDPYGRLESIKDKNGNILSETLYHYKQ